MTARKVAALAAIVAMSSGCVAAPQGIVVTGRVNDESVTVQAPALSLPRVNLDAGFQRTGTGPASLSAIAAQVGLGTVVQVSAVSVVEGQQVRAGDELLRFDDRALAAAVSAARADAAAAKSQVGVLGAAIDDTHDKQADVAEARRKVVDGIAKATRARTQLVGALAQARRQARLLPGKLAQVERTLRELRANLAQVEQGLAAARAALAALPPEAPPEQRAAIEASIAQLTAARAGLRLGIGKLVAARSQLRRGIAMLRAGIPKLTKAIRTVDAGLARTRDGLRRLDRAKERLIEARAQLKGLRSVAGIIADASPLAVDLARLQRGQAVVTAPQDGVVVALAAVGDVLSPGAAVAWLRAEARTVATWLTAAQLARLCPDAAVTVRLDGRAAAVAGRLVRVLPEAGYPPTSFATDEVHLTRAVPVEVELAEPLPAGLPVDLEFQPCAQEVPK